MDAHQFWSKDYETENVSEIFLIDAISISLQGERNQRFFLGIHLHHIEPNFLPNNKLVIISVNFE